MTTKYRLITEDDGLDLFGRQEKGPTTITLETENGLVTDLADLLGRWLIASGFGSYTVAMHLRGWSDSDYEREENQYQQFNKEWEDKQQARIDQLLAALSRIHTETSDLATAALAQQALEDTDNIYSQD